MPFIILFLLLCHHLTIKGSSKLELMSRHPTYIQVWLPLYKHKNVCLHICQYVHSHVLSTYTHSATNLFAHSSACLHANIYTCVAICLPVRTQPCSYAHMCTPSHTSLSAHTCAASFLLLGTYCPSMPDVPEGQEIHMIMGMQDLEKSLRE